MTKDIDPDAVPTGTGCFECEVEGSWWFHLRRCAACGHVGCCDSSLGRHASKHHESTGHRYVQSFEPGEEWWWDFVGQVDVMGPSLAPPTSHPRSQSVPGPRERVPYDWQEQLIAAETGA